MDYVCNTVRTVLQFRRLSDIRYVAEYKPNVVSYVVFIRQPYTKLSYS